MNGTCVGGGAASPDGDGATYTVAAQNSTNKAYADYVADGAGAETAINTALQAAYAGGRGGKVYLMEGDYYLSTGAGDKIQMATSTSLIGAGQSTVIHIASSTNATANAIVANTLSYITIADLFIDGNRGRNTSSQTGIQFTSVSSSTIRNVTVATTTDTGIYLVSSLNNTVIGNTFSGNGNNGFLLSATSLNNIVTGNTVNSNTNYGIYLMSSSNNIVTGNTANSNSYTGIYLAGSSNNNIVTGNTVNNNSFYGIFLSSSSNNTVTGNSLADNTAASANSSIRIETSDWNVISSNIIQDTAGTGYAIHLTSSASDNNVLIGNSYSGIGASSIQDLGTNTKYTQWDRLTLDTKQLGQVAYSPLAIFASSSVALASTTQMGSGKIMSLNNSSSEVFTVANNGYVGIGTTSPWAKLSVAGNIAIDTGVTDGYVYWNGQKFITASSTTYNTFMGLGAGTSSTPGINNTAFGYWALQANTGNFNTAFGKSTLMQNTTGNINTAIGEAVLQSNLTGGYNTGVGAGALSNNISGSDNTAVGSNSLGKNTTGGGNSAFGETSMLENTTGSFNSVFGGSALSNNTIGSYNNAFGHYSLIFNTTGSYNTALGNQAGYNVTTGYDNIFLGHDENVGGTAITTGYNNIGMGYNIKFPAVSSSNMMNIGNFLFANLPATTTGTTLTTQPLTGKLGVGTSSPYAKLTVWGGDTLDTSRAFEAVNSASTSLFSIFNNGLASTSNFIVSNTATTSNLAVTGGATSTFAGGIALSSGCFAVNGVCVGGGAASPDGDGATYTVAAQNSTNKAYADYVADGAGAETAINTALQAAYAGGRGGKVYLMEGDYYLSTGAGDKIQMATSTSLIGFGNSTVIHIASSTNATANAIAANTLSYVTIADLFVDGNQGRNTGFQNGIRFTSVASSTIRNITVATTTNHGIFLSSSNDNTLTGNTTNSNNGNGIYLSSSSNNTLTGNTANINAIGISLLSSLNNTLTGNIANSNSSIGISLSSSNDNILTGNTANSSGNFGIYLLSSLNNTVTGNTVRNNYDGMKIYLSSNNTLTGNTADSNSHYGFYLDSASNNTVTANSLYNNGAAGANSSIYIITSDGNVVSSNSIVDTAGTGYAIDIVNSTSDNNVLVGNSYSGTGASSINDLGTGTKYTEWDRLTLDTKQLGQVAYSPLSIFASSSVALASTTQMGTGKIMSLNNSSDEVFTVANSGNMGIGSTTPGSLLSLGTTNGINFTAATSTFNSTGGINLAAGCFAVNGTCLTSGASLSGGVAGMLSAWTSATTIAPTSTPNATAFNATSSLGGYYLNGVLGMAASSTRMNFYYAGATTTGSFTGGSPATGGNNIAMGQYAMQYATSGTDNFAVGFQALRGLSGTNGSTGAANNALGYQSLYSNTTGSSNNALGYSALYSNTNGSVNAALGQYALYSNTTGSYNNVLGASALYSNTTGSYNTALGVSALNANTTGLYNNALGYQALFLNNTGSYNTALGYQAGLNVTTGYDNIFLGHDQNSGGTAITTGYNNIGMGYNIKFPAVSSSNMMNIGNFLFANLPATTTNTSLTTQPLTGKLGVGTSSPYAKLTVWGGDTLATSMAFEVANSASTTLFTVLNNGNVGIGTSSPWAKLSVVGEVLANFFTATSSSATSSFVNMSVDHLEAGPAEFENDAGILSWIDMNITSLSAVGTKERYSAQLDGIPMLTISGEALSGGTVGSTTVNIGSTTPYYSSNIPDASLIVENGIICVNDDGGECSAAARTRGFIYGEGSSLAGIDVAEQYPTLDSAAMPGDIVMLDPAHPVFVKRFDKTVPGPILFGVVSTDPGVILGGFKVAGDIKDDVAENNARQIPIALVGRVPVTVSLEGGAIHVGDMIAPSSVIGVGKKAAPGEPTVGIALEPYIATVNNETTMKLFVFVQTKLSSLGSAVSGESVDLGNIWSVDTENNTMLANASINMQSFSIAEIGSLRGVANNWSLDENGVLKIPEVQTKKLCVGRVCIDEAGLRALLIQSGTPFDELPPEEGATGGSTSANSTPPTIEQPTVEVGTGDTTNTESGVPVVTESTVSTVTEPVTPLVSEPITPPTSESTPPVLDTPVPEPTPPVPDAPVSEPTAPVPDVPAPVISSGGGA
ncbi:MAG: hypothetical protein A3C14_01545 [Candidatus Lloydbacteria bacterium RIFCSPHIGHO2_02_FULL_50_18]|nr:MAG: hypothetical protein A3C14_01545 [Candidatus Lloydbacteria bacterium RIFCSPHIGHO2_02_FULL_50_18]